MLFPKSSCWDHTFFQWEFINRRYAALQACSVGDTVPLLSISRKGGKRDTIGDSRAGVWEHSIHTAMCGNTPSGSNAGGGSGTQQASCSGDSAWRTSGSSLLAGRSEPQTFRSLDEEQRVPRVGAPRVSGKPPAAPTQDTGPSCRGQGPGSPSPVGSRRARGTRPPCALGIPAAPGPVLLRGCPCPSPSCGLRAVHTEACSSGAASVSPEHLGLLPPDFGSAGRRAAGEMSTPQAGDLELEAVGPQGSAG